jgi:hypothetical protein
MRDQFTVYGVDFEVEYLMEGNYFPASYYEPAEYPEIEILFIQATDEDEYNWYLAEGKIPEGFEDSDDLHNILVRKILDKHFH